MKSLGCTAKVSVVAVLQQLVNVLEILTLRQVWKNALGTILLLIITYQELAEHYGTVVIPARVRKPKDKPNAEGVVGRDSMRKRKGLQQE